MTRYNTLILSAAFLFILFVLPSCLKNDSLDHRIITEPDPYQVMPVWKEIGKKIGSSPWKTLSGGDTLSLYLNYLRSSLASQPEGMYGAYKYPSNNLGIDLDSSGGAFITGLNIQSPVDFSSTDSSRLTFINIDEEKSKAQDSIIKDTMGIFQYVEIKDTLFLRDTLHIPHLELKYVKIE